MPHLLRAGAGSHQRLLRLHPPHPCMRLGRRQRHASGHVGCRQRQLLAWQHQVGLRARRLQRRLRHSRQVHARHLQRLRAHVLGVGGALLLLLHLPHGCCVVWVVHHGACARRHGLLQGRVLLRLLLHLHLCWPGCGGQMAACQGVLCSLWRGEGEGMVEEVWRWCGAGCLGCEAVLCYVQGFFEN
jgi:hypothetical protein